jgi:hypothetical protein
MNELSSQSKRIFLVGVCRNVENTIISELENLLNAIGQPCYKSLIIESDSDDETINLLRKFSVGKQYFRFESLGNLKESIPSRTARIAHCRNAYMEFLDKEARDQDFVVIADLDGANKDLTLSRFESIWTRTDWDVCTANQRFAYFDIWALRAKGWSEIDWMEEYNLLVEGGMRSQKALRIALYTKMKQIGEKNDWVSVDSAFGGLGVYKFQAIRGLRYLGELNGREICEHVPFHGAIRAKGGKIFIVPSLINCEFSSHTEILKYSIRLKTLILRSLKRISSST